MRPPHARVPRRLLFAVLVVGALLVGGCDADGDGVDDTTGAPVAAPQSPGGGSGSGGCGPGGWALLCGGDPASEAVEANPERMALAARHEAGHVVVAREYGAKTISAQINPDGSGRTDWCCVRRDPQLLVAIMVAGVVAAGTDEGAKDDYADIDQVLQGVPAGERDRIASAARGEAARIVAERTSEIERDAAVLRDRGRL